jgi:hypothetical protein
LLLAVSFWLFPNAAQAYPWLIRHHYPSCAACHIDPSGGGLPTAYGRYIGDAILPTLASTEDSPASDAKGGTDTKGAGPEWLQVGGDYRAMWLRTKVPQAPLSGRMIWMQADLEAAVTAGGFVASASLGYAYEGALGAAITRRVDQNLVSRYHWLGYSFESAGVLLRAGRMNLPFGIRTVEHNLWAKALTRTTINDDQQYGAAVSYSGDNLRGEVMAIAGNLQLRPDRYRERGYSAFVEWAAKTELQLGLSSLITHRDLDTLTLKETWRQTHGVFGRWATPWQPLVLQTEWNYVFVSSKDERWRRGLASFVQADVEPWQGVHFLATAEANKVGTGKRFWAYGGWLSYWWFVAPHVDVRLDGLLQSLGSTEGRYGAYTLLLQGHVYL